MFCHSCGTEIIEGHSFCGKCGKPVNDWLKEAIREPEKESSSTVAKVVLAALVTILAMMFIGALVSNSDEKPNSSSAQAAPKIRLPIIRHETQSVLTGSHIVQPSQYVSYTIRIVPEMRNARISGRFTATGGSGNDLQALITDEDGLLNFKNGHEAKVYYQSGKVTADSFDVRLNPGTYYLVFNNGFSVLSNKAYDADVKIDYDHEIFQ